MITITVKKREATRWFKKLRSECSIEERSRLPGMALHTWRWALDYATHEALEKAFNVELTAEPEHIPVRGNAIVSGDDDYDKEVEDSIISDLEKGNKWAWCCAAVEVSYVCPCCGHEPDSHTEYLGGCSYKDADDFKRGGYYCGMIKDALSNMGIEHEIKYE